MIKNTMAEAAITIFIMFLSLNFGSLGCGGFKAPLAPPVFSGSGPPVSVVSSGSGFGCGCGSG
jgi:hypothetical protein